jgi:hypothetical protein
VPEYRSKFILLIILDWRWPGWWLKSYIIIRLHRQNLINTFTLDFHKRFGGNHTKWNNETKKLFVFLLGIQLHSIVFY